MSNNQTIIYKKPNILKRAYLWCRNIFRRVYLWCRKFPRRFEKSNYEKYALREFEYAGWIKDGKWADDMQELMCKQVLQLLRTFSKHGHGGSSYWYAINLFKTLASFDPIGSIKCTDDEWDINDWNGENYQNKRLSSVFKDGKKGKPFYLNAIVWKEEDGVTFTGKVEDVTSRQFIKLPFSPKTFYIDVIKKKADCKSKDGECDVQCGDEDYVSLIKDRKQLLKVVEYYNTKDMNCG